MGRARFQMRQPAAPWTALITLALLGASGSVRAEPCATYRVAHYAQGLLFFRDEQGREAGVDADVARELARRTGCNLVEVLESRVRIWDQFRHGALDITLSAVPSPEREQLAELVPYLKGRSFIVTRGALAAELPNADSFVAASQLRVAVVKTYLYGAKIDGWLGQLRAQRRVEEMADFAAAARLFESGRVDAIVVNPLSYPALLKLVKPTESLHLPPWGRGDKTVVCVALSRTRVSDQDRRRIRMALNDMIRDGTMEAIAKRYVGANTAHDLVFDGKTD